MPVVFETVPLGTARRKRQDGIEAVERLNGRLFVEAKDGSVLRRIQIEPDDIGRFRFKVRIGRSHVPLDPVRLDACSRPYASNEHVIHSEMLGQTSRAPVGRAISGLPSGGSKDLRLHLRDQHGRLSSLMTAEQPGQPFGQKTLLPQTDVPGIASDPLLHSAITCAIGQHQDQSRTPRIVRSEAAGPSSHPQFLPLLGCQDNVVFSHAPLSHAAGYFIVTAKNGRMSFGTVKTYCRCGTGRSTLLSTHSPYARTRFWWQLGQQ